MESTSDAADLRWLQERLESHHFRFARTMPHNPHDYTLRSEWDDDEFVRAVVLIRRLGYRSTYRGRPYIQIDLGEFFYWTMGDTIPRTILINRKPLSAKEADS